MEYKDSRIEDYLSIVYKLKVAIEKGLLQLDPNDKNRILVYRNAGLSSPEGWYSENILDVARELHNDPENYKNFQEAISLAFYTEKIG